MDTSSYENLLSQYSSLMTRVQSIEPVLKLLYRDRLLNIEKNFRITYAVDFHEVWNFAGPIAQLMQGQPLSKVLSQENLMEKQIGRAGLFYGLEDINNCLLLPPYLAELSKKVDKVRKEIFDKTSRIDQSYVRKLDQIINDNEIKNSLLEFQENGQIPAGLPQKLRELLEERASELLFLISGLVGDGLGVINNLFASNPPRLHLSSSKWPQLRPAIQAVMDLPPSVWFKYFQRIRRQPKYATSNLRDAKAIELVLMLNQHLIKDREIVLIVSDTSAMKNVLEKRPADFPDEAHDNCVWTRSDGLCIKVPGVDEPVPIYRPVEMFYYSILTRGSLSKNVLENIKNELDYLDKIYVWEKSFKELMESYRNPKNDTKKYEKETDTFQKIQDELIGHNEHVNNLQNVLLAVNRYPVLRPYWEQIKKQQTSPVQKINESILSLIKFLSEPRKTMENEFREREQELLSLIENDLNVAINLVTEVSFSYQTEIRDGLKRYTRTHYRIFFEDQSVRSLLDELEQSRYSGDVQKTTLAVKKLFNLAFQKELGAERPLLWTVLLLSCGLQDRAIWLATRMLRDAISSYREEYLYIRALAYYENKNYQKSAIDCEAGIKKYIDDPRFPHLLGVLIANWLQDEPSRCKYELDGAIENSKQAHILASTDEKYASLRAAIANNLSYLLYLRDEEWDFKEALYYIDELDKLSVPSEEPEYLHTRGCILWRDSLRDENNTTRKQKAIDALRYLNEAVEIGNKTGIAPKKIQHYENDLQKARQQISHFTE